MDAEPGQSEAEAAGASSLDEGDSLSSASSADPADGTSRGGAGKSSASNGAGGAGAPKPSTSEAGTANGGTASGSGDNGSGDNGDVNGSAAREDDGSASAADGEDGGAASAADAAVGPGGKGGKRKRSLWRELFVVVVAALILTILIKAFLVQVFSIPSASMENTLQVGDRILVNRLVYHLRDIARGDVIVFSGAGSWDPPAPPPPSNPIARAWDKATDLVGISVPGTDYVKRVIGLPGDHVVCCDSRGRVTVNGVALNEQSYLYPGDPPSLIPINIVVPQGRVFVLGDNRSDSADSRYHKDDPGQGTIPENEIVGRAFVLLWPPSRIGDIPIPNTFQQAGLSAAAAAVSYGPAVGGGSAAAGALIWRRRREKGIPSG